MVFGGLYRTIVPHGPFEQTQAGETRGAGATARSRQAWDDGHPRRRARMRRAAVGVRGDAALRLLRAARVSPRPASAGGGRERCQVLHCYGLAMKNEKGIRF